MVVGACEEEEVTASGIVLPDTAKEKPQRGVVLAVGPGGLGERGERVALEVVEGWTEVKVDGVDYLILRESDVLAKVV